MEKGKEKSEKEKGGTFQKERGETVWRRVQKEVFLLMLCLLLA